MESMGKRKDDRSPRPTDAELQILQVLWAHGPSTVRDVHGSLSPTTGTGYTTVLKMLQIMLKKGLVCRDEDARSHVYRAAETKEVSQRSLVRDIIHRAFHGDASRLVMQAIESNPPSESELREIREALDALERQERG